MVRSNLEKFRIFTMATKASVKKVKVPVWVLVQWASDKCEPPPATLGPG
jgi:hypothetical protein